MEAKAELPDQLDLYDEKVQEAISWTLRQVGEAVGLSDWAMGDGSESVEGDVNAEIFTILSDAGLYDDNDGRFATLSAPPANAVGGEREKLIRLIASFPAHAEDRGPDNEVFADVIPMDGAEIGDCPRPIERLADAILAALSSPVVGDVASKASELSNSNGRLDDLPLPQGDSGAGDREAIAEAFRKGAMYALGRTPWEDADDFFSLCGIDYATGKPLPARPMLVPGEEPRRWDERCVQLSIDELDQWDRAGLPLDEIENPASFCESVSCVLGQLKYLRALASPTASTEAGEGNVAVLREALEPFARAADKLDGLWNDQDWRWNDSTRSGVTVAHIRAVRAFLSKVKDQKD